ncbi:hypothetical protein [Pseudomonas sp. B21-053]|uniref:hypothetical protein n=1 Tax=Pseudomonas sp. B21-053 TaxID=2895493 RepID=UPI0022325407|nr:hypothetical protein [Pseudomonas sp. B21-053]UZE14147.1 hypothetical protein LOY68_11230 [Pseudomonas sp. B21-053]
MAINFFTDENNYLDEKKIIKKNFEFKVYKNRALVNALEQIFNGKCAYCESRFAHVTSYDIEHYRPKLKISNEGELPLRPGYFWLAGEWSNLLISCPDCNRSRGHAVPGSKQKRTLGKLSQFPLSDETQRVRDHTADIASEEPYRLLLDPCKDQPEKYLTFDINGFVRARTDFNNLPNRRGSVSINVFALQRQALVHERLRVITDFQYDLYTLRMVVKDLAGMDSNNVLREDLEEKRLQFRIVKERLRKRFEAGAPYLGMLREHVRVNLSVGSYKDLYDAGIDLSILVS